MYLTNNVAALRLAVIQILDHALDYEWSVQGFGMLRLYIRKIGRLHIWDDHLRYPNVSMIHNHSWDLRSTVVCGALANARYSRDDVIGRPYKTHRMITGYNCVTVSPVVDVRLLDHPIERYQPGDDYAQRAHEIHETLAKNGTVTIMQRNEDDNGQADIFWPADCTWGTAKPRAATQAEIQSTVERALGLLV
jgi:hypothetical protein